MIEMVFEFASLCFHSLCHVSMSFWPLRRWSLFLHTSDMPWLLTYWSVECARWLCQLWARPSRGLYVSACTPVPLSLPWAHAWGSLLEDEKHLEVGQVAPVALADSQPTPRCVCEPSQIQQCCQADPQMIPATRAIRVWLHATESLWFFVTWSNSVNR